MFSLSTATFEDLHSVIRDLGSGFHRLDCGGKIQIYNTLNQVNFFENQRPIGNILFPANEGRVMFAPADMNGVIMYDGMNSVPTDTRIVDTAWPNNFGIRARDIDAMVVELITEAVKAADVHDGQLDPRETDSQKPVTFVDVCQRMNVGRIPKAICKKFDGLTAKTNGPRELTVLIDGKSSLTLLFFNKIGEKEGTDELMVNLVGYCLGVLDPHGSVIIPATTAVMALEEYPQPFDRIPRVKDLKLIANFLTELARS